MRRLSKSEAAAVAREVADAVKRAPRAFSLAFDIRTQLYGPLLHVLSIEQGEEWESIAGLLEMCGFNAEPDITEEDEATYRARLAGLVATLPAGLGHEERLS